MRTLFKLFLLRAEMHVSDDSAKASKNFRHSFPRQCCRRPLITYMRSRRHKCKCKCVQAFTAPTFSLSCNSKFQGFVANGLGGNTYSPLTEYFTIPVIIPSVLFSVTSLLKIDFLRGKSPPYEFDLDRRYSRKIFLQTIQQYIYNRRATPG